MSENNKKDLQAVIRQFKEDKHTDVDPEWQKYLSNIQCGVDAEGMHLIKTVGTDENNLILQAGTFNNGDTGVIAFTFVQKHGYFGLQIISTTSDFIPGEDFTVTIHFLNGVSIQRNFSSAPIKVEDTDYTANYLQLADGELQYFIQFNLKDWQMSSPIANTTLNSNFSLGAPGILPLEDARYLFRSMAAAIGTDYLETNK